MTQAAKKESMAICMQRVSKKYGRQEVLSNVSLGVPRGKIYGLLGPSGCGKSTTVKILAGILSGDSGSVQILDQEMPNTEVKRQIGYMTQATALYPTLTAEENLKFFGRLYGMRKEQLKQRMDCVMELVHLTEDRKKAVHKFSGGMKQRLSLAVTLLADPSILILDEPTVGIDPVLRKEIWEELQKLTERHVTILVTTHIMDEAEKCHELAMMREGKILTAGTSKKIREQSGTQTLEEAFIYYCNASLYQRGGC